MARVTDQWGSELGTQAARINELLTGGDYLSAGEIYNMTVGGFPTITVGRVHQHFRWLRDNHPARLQRLQQGHRVSYRLV
jgi:hypothetical protein